MRGVRANKRGALRALGIVVGIEGAAKSSEVPPSEPTFPSCRSHAVSAKRTVAPPASPCDVGTPGYGGVQ